MSNNELKFWALVALWAEGFPALVDFPTDIMVIEVE